MAVFTVCSYVGLLLITIALLHLQLYYGIILMQKLKIDQHFPFSSQNLKKQNLRKANNHFSLGNRRENVILCKLQNKASNLNAHLFKDFVIAEIRCHTVGLNLKKICIFPECP